MSTLAEQLADALNGLNNAAASTVSAPVDAISWGLRKAGLGNVIGQAPVGGSDWMRAKGLTRPTNGLAGDIGEFAGNVLPIAAAAKAPQIANGLLKMGENALAPSTLGSQRGAVLFNGVSPTVANAQRVAFPGIYENPSAMVEKAAANVAPENPLMQQLFGVNRNDLFDISQYGSRPGNINTGPLDYPFKVAPNAKGAAVTPSITTSANTQRLQDIIGEASNHPDLYKGMASWYTMDPLYPHFERIWGPQAAEKYKQFNTLTGMSSPGSEVLTELNRGTAANWLHEQGRFEDFKKFAGMAEHTRGAGFPEDMRGVMGHAYHKTAQAGPMETYLRTGAADMGSAKVPSYIAASGVPETGFQTTFPVGDAHWSRLMGLADVRGQTTSKGVPTVPGAAASSTEMADLGPYFRDKIATPMGLQAVPAQAVVWGAGSHATGVTSPIGAPKLELLAQQIGKAAKRMGVTPEQARDLIISGKAHAGEVDADLLKLLGAGGAGFAAGTALRPSDGP